MWELVRFESVIAELLEKGKLGSPVFNSVNGVHHPATPSFRQ